jgi:hypothetical protein
VAPDADAGGRHVEQLSGLMLGQNPGDVVVDHHHLVDMPEPLLREHADRGRAAADAHPFLARAVDDRRLARLDTIATPPSICRSTACRLHRCKSASQVARPSFFEPPVRWCTPPRLSIWLPYSPVVTWPTASSW